MNKIKIKTFDRLDIYPDLTVMTAKRFCPRGFSPAGQRSFNYQTSFSSNIS